MKFREDINGLRAIAVIAVVLFHFNPSWMPGGFAGVDVFFVISGFLMTGIIFKGIEQENFSILKFYVARANRIIPALALLCFTLIIFGWFFLSPIDYKQLAKHAASSISFLSNMTYWGESGYFDTSSHEKWLLHTWSLSVEWQFYILYPIFLVFFSKLLSMKNLKLLVLLGTVLGFIFCVFATYKWPNPSYFLFPTRAWEMMIGGVAYLYPFNLKDRQKKVTEFIGVILIFSSYIFISKDTPWPGYSAIFPVFGSFMLIQAQTNSFITCNKVFQKLGAWSYSIYLWHWPLVVAIFYFALNSSFIYLGIILSILLGYLSHTYIEKIKFRNDFIGVFSYLKCKSIYISLFVFILSGFIYKNITIFYNIPKEIVNGSTVDKYTDNNKEYTFEKHIELNQKLTFAKDKYKVLIIGDSQAGDLINALYSTGVNEGADYISRLLSVRCGAFYLQSSSLIKMLKTQDAGLSNSDLESCKKTMSKLFSDSIISEADSIILSMQWYDRNVPFVLESLNNLKVTNPKADIFLIGGKIFKEEVPTMLYNAYIKNIDVSEYAYNKIGNNTSLSYKYQNDIFTKNQSSIGYNYINMTNILCKQQRCSVVTMDNNPIYYDTGHVTRAGAKLIGDKLRLSEELPVLIFSK